MSDAIAITTKLPPTTCATLSLVIPVFNEGKDLSVHLPIILGEIDLLRCRYKLEVVLVDDGSKDLTWKEICALQNLYPEVVGIRFTRNFGKEAAIMAGIERAIGDAVIVLDSDLQHPPKFIPDMVKLWEKGSKVVEMHKASNKAQSAFYRSASRLFYGLLNIMSKMDLRDNCDFKLLDREVVNQLLAMPEKQRFFRGLVQWLGFPSTVIDFTVPERSGGVTKWSLVRLARYAVDNITSFTAWPLFFAAWLGSGITVLGLFFVVIAIFQKISGTAEDGFTTVISLVVLFGGLNLLVLGFIGFYLARVFDEIKGRPRYIVRDSFKKNLCQSSRNVVEKPERTNNFEAQVGVPIDSAHIQTL